MSHALAYEPVYAFLICKPDFALCRVDVHVDALGIEIKKQHVGRMVAFCQQRAIAFADRMEHCGIADGTSVHEKILRRSRRARLNRIDHDAADRASGDAAPHLYCPLEKRLSIHLQNPIAIGSNGRMIQDFLPVVGQSKMDERPGEGRLLDDGADV